VLYFQVSFFYISYSASSIWERNNNLVKTINELEDHVQSLEDVKEKLKQELSDQYSQVSRLKLEVLI
jgi:hypothetical protein